MRSRNNKVIFLKTHYDLDMLCDFPCYCFVIFFVIPLSLELKEVI